MARESRESQRSRGVSLNIDDAVESAGFQILGRGLIKLAEFAEVNYKKKNETKDKLSPALCLTVTQDGADLEASYGVGDGWGIADSGQTLVPKKGQTGLTGGDRACGAFRLLASLVACGMPKDWVSSPDRLEGADVEFELEAQPKGSDRKSLSLITKVYDAPWESKSGGGGRGSKGKSRDVEPDDDAKPKRRGARADADDDADAKPARRGRKHDDDDDAKPAKGNGKAAASDAADDEDLKAAATEAIIDVLEAESDNLIRLRDLEDALLDGPLKKAKNAEDIVAVAVDPDFLDTEAGWEFDGKTVELKKKGKAKR